MIIYQATKREFLAHALSDEIEDVVSRHYQNATGARAGSSEVQSWKHSLVQMEKVLRDEEIPADVGVAIEYQLPLSRKRIDFVISGTDEAGISKAIIVELKQWSAARLSEKDGLIWARRGGQTGEREGAHPSYQAWTYAAFLAHFNEAVHDGDAVLQPCAYLHNYDRDGVIDHVHYQDHLARAPLFLRGERAKLQAFIRHHVRRGDSGKLLYSIEAGRIKPSKMLADSVVGMLQGRTEFILLDDQKVVHETVLAVEAKALAGTKQVVIVRGGPGTGKSVVAINLLATLTGKQRNARYVSKNAAPRAVYEARLTGSFRRSHIANLFSGSGAFTQTPADLFDALIVDEAHRLNEKGGLYGNLGENQIKELIQAAKCTVFFVDDDQVVTLKDIGHSGALRKWAQVLGAEVTELELSSQFRCEGSDGYLAWLDDTLGIRPTANQNLSTDEFDFRVLDSPKALHDLIELKNRASNKARVVAGYCWEWNSKRDPNADDIVIGDDYRRQWNLDKDGSLWVVAPESVAQVGCIHTCQGLEVDYVGVIVGPDLVLRGDQVQAVSKGRARSDKSLSGLKKMATEDAEGAGELASRIIRNTYRTLMTRGMRGCYVYCTDQRLAKYFQSRLVTKQQPDRAQMTDSSHAEAPPSNVIPLRRVTDEERRSGTPAAPLVELRFAAGAFSESQITDLDSAHWVELPNWVSMQPGLFVAQVVGESMNRKIPNGSWNLFRSRPTGTRQGKIVVVQHRDIQDSELGSCYTIKRYESKKLAEADGSWRHVSVTLSPESHNPSFRPIVIEDADEEGFDVVAEWLAVL